MARVLVTGMGRSGTGYMAALFTAAGLPCGHEALYDSPTATAPSWRGVRAESSWYAVPWVSQLPTDVHVVRLVRHPLHWLSSWALTVWIPQRLRAPPTRYLARHTGTNWCKLAQRDPIDASMRLWVRWHSLLSERSPRVPELVRVEDVDQQWLAALLHRRIGITQQTATERADEAITATSTRVNARKHAAISWRNVASKPHARLFRERAAEFGYEW